MRIMHHVALPFFTIYVMAQEEENKEQVWGPIQVPPLSINQNLKPCRRH